MSADPAGPAPEAAIAELRALYEEFDRDTAAVAPVCRASGRCCDFPAWGHTLFASRLETWLLVSEGASPGRTPAGSPTIPGAPSALCPWWKERRCTARAPRPLGCRAFFCDESKTEAMQALHERALRRLKDLHDRHGLAWDYAPLLRQLARVVGGA